MVGLKSGKKVHGDALLYVVGRQANTDGLNLEAAGLSRNPRGLLSVNTKYQTKKPHMYVDTAFVQLYTDGLPVLPWVTASVRPH